MPLQPTHSRPAFGDRDGSLRDAIAALVADCCRDLRDRGLPDVSVTIDIPVGRSMPAADASVRRLLEPLLRRAIESAARADGSGDAPLIRELVVTGIDAGTAIEIEVADSGTPLSPAVRSWLAGDDDTMPEDAGLALAAVRAGAARIGGTVRALNCPEGGVAVTLRIPHRQARRLAA